MNYWVFDSDWNNKLMNFTEAFNQDHFIGIKTTLLESRPLYWKRYRQDSHNFQILKTKIVYIKQFVPTFLNWFQTKEKQALFSFTTFGKALKMIYCKLSWKRLTWWAWKIKGWNYFFCFCHLISENEHYFIIIIFTFNS